MPSGLTDSTPGIGSLAAPEADADPHSYFHRLRPGGPIQWSEVHRAWVAISHAAVLEGFKATWLSSERLPAFERIAARSDERFARVVDLLRGWMVFRDPPAHTRLRDPVRLVFTPRRIAALEPRIGATANRLLDAFEDGGGGNLSAAYARPLPALVIADLLGIPGDDREDFQHWSDELAGVVFAAEARPGGTERASDAAARFFDYFGELVEHRRRHPGDDVVSALVGASGPGAPDPADLVGACTLLLFAGHETTADLLANSATVLLGPRGETALQQLRGAAERWPGAVDELLRLEGPAKVMVRKAVADHEWQGVPVRAGDSVFLAILAADHDPAVFTAPDELDIARDPNPHLAFGWGLHHCLGAALARMEGRVALHRLFERFPGLSLTRQPRWGGGFLGRGVNGVDVALR